MVLSASGVHSYDEDGSPWAIFAKQVLWTVVGLVAFYVALRMPVQLMRQAGVPRLRVHHRPAGPGADPGNRQGGQRFSRLVRGRRVLHAAVGTGQDRVRDLGRAPAGRPPPGARVAARDAVPAGARRGDRPGPDRRCSPTSGRRCRWASSCSACSGTRACRCGCSSARWSRSWSRRPCWRCPRATAPTACSPGSNPGADAQGSGYQARQARFALANGGVFGDGLGPGHREVELPAQRAQRLHLRDHRRGTRASSAPSACCACSACSPTPACGSPAARPTRSCGC